VKPTDVAELVARRTVQYSAGDAVSATRVYQVLRTLGATEPTLSSISGLPAPGSAHPVYSQFVATDYAIREGADGKRWEIEITYQRPPAMSGASGGMRVVSVSVSASSEQRDLTHAAASSAHGGAAAGEPILNSAGDAFEETLRIEAPIIEITIVRDENTAYASRMALHGTLNSSATTVAGFAIAKHQGRLLVSGEPSDSAEYAYRYTYRVQIRSNVVGSTDIGWEEAILQQGYYYIDFTERVRATEEIEDENGATRIVPSTKPVLLDADGGLSTSPVYLYVCPYPEGDWSSLSLPS